ncbi:MAG: GAF domain-containing sensor histidine kinase [Propioniciclava sp.]|uniref:sensor histidine kinase n=1 Tax=Propioniciclava sp. TaxID=2038686 RepID=UPI0039E2AF38
MPRSPAIMMMAGGLVVIAGVFIALAGAGVWLGHSDMNGPTAAPLVVLALGCIPVGIFLVLARPANAVGLFLSLVGLTALLAVAAMAWAAIDVWALVAESAWWVPLVLVVATLVLYPEGRAIGTRRRGLLLVMLIAGAVATLTLACAAYLDPGGLLNENLAQGEMLVLRVSTLVAITIVVLAAAGAVVDLVRRAQRATPLERSQLRALLPAGLLIVGGIILDAMGVPYATVPGLLAVPLGMGVAILAHHLDDLDLLVNRSLVWFVLTACLFAVFGGTVALINAAVTLLDVTAVADQAVIAAALGTAAITVGLDPVRRRVQRAVDRLLFGERDDPLKVLGDLGRRMQAASDPGELLADLVAAVSGSLRVPYVRMEVRGSDGQTLTAVEDGRPQAELSAFPMRAHGEEVGRLMVAPRRIGEAFTPREVELLQDVAGQAAIAARSYRITLELRQARESLVRSREDERLRIRRDLHDGLGPAIAGARMQVAAARNASRTADAEPLNASADPLISVQDTLTECSQEIRRIVDGLRPGALDRGLLAAIEQRAEAIGPVPSVTVASSGDLTELGAAVEVAVFRIVTEALSNAARHAGAEQVWVTLDGSGAGVEVEIRDDGHGGANPRDGGVGMESMRHRAEELGGQFAVDSGATGTTIRLRLPR